MTKPKNHPRTRLQKKRKKEVIIAMITHRAINSLGDHSAKPSVEGAASL
jgi:hypothetical protein